MFRPMLMGIVLLVNCMHFVKFVLLLLMGDGKCVLLIEYIFIASFQNANTDLADAGRERTRVGERIGSDQVSWRVCNLIEVQCCNPTLEITPNRHRIHIFSRREARCSTHRIAQKAYQSQNIGVVVLYCLIAMLFGS